LLDRRDLVRGFLHGQRRADVRGTPAIHHAIILDEIANGTDGIVQCALRFVDDLKGSETVEPNVPRGDSLHVDRAHHFVTPANENGHGAGVGTLLDDHHLIPRGSKGDFPDDSRLP